MSIMVKSSVDVIRTKVPTLYLSSKIGIVLTLDAAGQVCVPCVMALDTYTYISFP
jgi:hypothetical protein